MPHSAESIHNLKLIGGWLCLDFCNTADRLNSQIAHDWLTSSSDVTAWGERVGIHTTTVVGEDGHMPDSLQPVLELRELIYRLFTSIADAQQPREVDLNTFNDLLRDTLGHVEIISGEAGYQWGWAGNLSGADQICWSVIRSAAELLTSPELRLLRQCPAEDCGWLFLDTSRNHSRRWCDMDDCGNRAKARRHYARAKK